MDSYLDMRNISRSADGVEYHPLRPFLPINARVLFLGSFPPPRSKWSMDFFYPNFINDHWRIEGEVFHDDKDFFVAKGGKGFDISKVVDHCERLGIAFYDTAVAVRRLKGNASDKFLEVVESTRIELLTAQLPHLRALVTTGAKATATVCAYYGITQLPPMNGAVNLNNGLELYRLPSSSRAYPLSLECKVKAYRFMFQHYNYF